MLSAHFSELPEDTPVEIWFQDEARIGQNNGIVRQWSRRGSRPRQPADQRYENAYLLDAIYPARGTGASIAVPHADTEARLTAIHDAVNAAGICLIGSCPLTS